MSTVSIPLSRFSCHILHSCFWELCSVYCIIWSKVRVHTHIQTISTKVRVGLGTYYTAFCNSYYFIGIVTQGRSDLNKRLFSALLLKHSGWYECRHRWQEIRDRALLSPQIVHTLHFRQTQLTRQFSSSVSSRNAEGPSAQNQW